MVYVAGKIKSGKKNKNKINENAVHPQFNLMVSLRSLFQPKKLNIYILLPCLTLYIATVIFNIRQS